MVSTLRFRGGLAAGTLLFTTWLSVLAGSQIPAGATPAGVAASGQCDLPQPPSAEYDYAPLVNQSNNLALNDRTWISVGEVDFRQASWWVAHDSDDSDVDSDPDAVPPPVIRCTLLTPDKLDRVPQVAAAVKGADDCKAGTEVCELPAGVSAGGDPQYRLSITEEQARSIVEEVAVVTNRAILQHDGRYYLFQLFTTDEEVRPQARVEFLDPHFAGNTIDDQIIRLERGQSITVPFVVRTFATFGKPANITLSAGVHARDAGVTATIEPSTFLIPERSAAKGNLTIAAGANVQEGIYRFSMVGSEGWIRTCGMYTDYECPLVQVGDSIWQINTSDGGVGMGGRAPPQWLTLTTETDRDVYGPGETITIRSYIDNNGNQTVVLKGARLIIDIGNATVYDNPNASTTALNVHYTIDAYPYDGKEHDIIIQPQTKVLLVRPFYWNQEVGRSYFSDGLVAPPQIVQPGNYTIYTSLSGYEGSAIYDRKDIMITTAAAAPSDDAVDIAETGVVAPLDGMQTPLIIGAIVAAAGVVALLALRKKK
ncbi:MAG TPA: hypothetical protein VF172_12050 [Nitrososphaera sp.]|jgi:hypothetical protein